MTVQKVKMVSVLTVALAMVASSAFARPAPQVKVTAPRPTAVADPAGATQVAPGVTAVQAPVVANPGATGAAQQEAGVRANENTAEAAAASLSAARTADGSASGRVNATTLAKSIQVLDASSNAAKVVNACDRAMASMSEHQKRTLRPLADSLKLRAAQDGAVTADEAEDTLNAAARVEDYRSVKLNVPLVADLERELSAEAQNNLTGVVRAYSFAKGDDARAKQEITGFLGTATGGQFQDLTGEACPLFQEGV